MKTGVQQRQAARKFVEYWTFQRGSEKGEDQQFWNSLLRDVLGVTDVEQHIKYQVPVPMVGRGDPTAQQTTKFLDAWIPETRVLIEHKSRGVNLDAPQAGHGGLTPYEQAVEYDNARAFDEKARWIVTCNFDEFRIYDRTKPLAQPLKVGLGDLPKESHRLAFLVNSKEKAIDRELEISVQAGRIVGEIYDALLAQYCGGRGATALPGDGRAGSPLPAGDHLAALNRLCVRLVFCLYAEDAEIFPKDCFKRLVENTPAPFLRERMKKLFEVLDTPLGKRDPYLESDLCAFPYTNGGLFRMENGKGRMENEGGSTILHSLDDIPPLTEEIRQLLIGASQFDWRDITPTIFGALFESTLNPVTRRAGGMVYTSVENIHKVIDPLFLDDLTRRVNEVLGTTEYTEDTEKKTSVYSVSSVVKKKLLALQDEMAALTFLDPACGSGNFLTETYICLRRLENRIIAALQRGQAEFDLGLSVKVSIAQFFGLEINDFAVAVAKTALWIAEAQMLRETAEILHREPDYLPLHDYANIIEGNALRMDWPHTDYIMGNPPFGGKKEQSLEQKADIAYVFGLKKASSVLDHVTAWYKKALDLIEGTKTECAFVSTNSICQGEHIPAFWNKYILPRGVHVNFAHQTFKWSNEAKKKAAVHCVIVGFSFVNRAEKRLFSYDTPTSKPHETVVPNINAYLYPADNALIERRDKDINAPFPMSYGNVPLEWGTLMLTEEERATFITADSRCEPLIKFCLGGDEFLNGGKRYCLWLVDAAPMLLKSLPMVAQRVALCREKRLASKDAGARKLADRPTQFRDTNNPDTAIVIPKVSSERRKYIPLGFIGKDTIVTGTVLIIPNGTLYMLGVLSSAIHMAWMKVVGGRMKSDYQYSKDLVYNNFVWPSPMNEQKAKIEEAAQAILDVRAKYAEQTLAALYDPLFMPTELLKAHQANDRAVLAAYGLAPDTPEQEIVAHLFKLYAEKVNGGK